MRHVISALVQNEPGVLASVAGLFSARGFNIDSLVVGRTENPELSRMTVVCIGDDNTLELARTGVIAMARGTQQAKDEAADKAPATGGKRKRSLDAPAQAALPPS